MYHPRTAVIGAGISGPTAGKMLNDDGVLYVENTVEHAERLPGGGWEPRTARTGTRYFDLLVVANGHHHSADHTTKGAA